MYEILGLNFDLGHLNMNNYLLKGINLAKDYKNDAYDKW
jgi:hypothetical protein